MTAFDPKRFILAKNEKLGAEGPADFKCAWEAKNGPDAKRCQAQCESCRMWWPPMPVQS